MMTYIITVNHGALASKEKERTFFIVAENKKEAYKKAKENLQYCGIDGYEYIVSIREA